MATIERSRGDALIFDPFAGASGDMVLGALMDLGLEPEWLRSLVASLEPAVRVRIDRVKRCGLSCGQVRFEMPTAEPDRRLDEILELIDRSPIPEQARVRATAVYRRLATAEAALHDQAVEDVHLHEVGALDSVLDVVAGVGGAWELGYRQFYTRPIAVGTGTVTIRHGNYPVPSPATVRLLEGLPVRNTGYGEECTTPTGAALIAELTGGASPPAEVVYGGSGYGAGTRDPGDRPNCLRLIEARLGTCEEGTVYAVAADIDDMAPEYVAVARDAVLAAGAADCTMTRVDMKKGRPGVRLEALVPAARLDAVSLAVFRATTTIGMRYWPVERVRLERAEGMVEWRGCDIRVKRVRLPDGRERWKPELDDVVAAARKTGLTPYEVRNQLDVMEPGGFISAKERGHDE